MDSRVVVSNFSDIFQSLVIRENAKIRAPNVAAKALDRPLNVAFFQIERESCSTAS